MNISYLLFMALLCTTLALMGVAALKSDKTDDESAEEVSGEGSAGDKQPEQSAETEAGSDADE